MLPYFSQNIQASNQHLASPGSSMKSCRSWEYKFDSGETLTFIDTPGFGSGIDHREVLQGLMTFLQSNPQLHVIAAVYLYGITSTRLHRTKGRDMDVFCGICGDFFYQNVIFISTHWDSINVAAKSRMEFYERSLCRGSLGWAKMLAKGAKYMRFEGTESSVRAILEACWRKRDHAPPQINLILETRCSGMLEVSTAYAALLDFGTQSTSNALPVVHWTAKDLGIERTWWQFLRSFWSGWSMPIAGLGRDPVREFRKWASPLSLCEALDSIFSNKIKHVWRSFEHLDDLSCLLLKSFWESKSSWWKMLLGVSKPWRISALLCLVSTWCSKPPGVHWPSTSGIQCIDVLGGFWNWKAEHTKKNKYKKVETSKVSRITWQEDHSKFSIIFPCQTISV